jgi:hypothetical protein
VHVAEADAFGVALRLGRQRLQVERKRVHLHALAAVGLRPGLARAIAVELDAEAVGIVEVQRLGDEVVARARECRALLRHAQQGGAELAARRIQEGAVEEARRVLRGRPGPLRGAQREQVARRRAHDPLVELRAGLWIADAQL